MDHLIMGRGGIPKADASLRDFDNIPMLEDPDEYFSREVLAHVPDAFVDHSKTKEGYEISFTRYFYRYQTLRSLEQIREDILALEAKTDGLLQEVIK